MQRCDSVPTRPAARLARARLRRLVQSTAAALLLAAGPALGAEVKPGSVPLAAVAPLLPASCHAATDFDGTADRRQLRADAKKFGHASLLGTVNAQLSAPRALVAICDPAVAAARRFIGPITGEVRAGAPTDSAWFGTRSLLSRSSNSQAAALDVGDRLALPPVGSGSQIDVAVRTPGGVRSVRISADGPTPTGLRIEGSPSSPVVVMDRAGGEPTRQPVAPVPPGELRIKISVSEHRLVVRGTGAPEAVVGIAAFREDGNRTVVATDFVPASGRLPKLKADRLTRRHIVAQVFQWDPSTRARTVIFCPLRWSRQETLRSARCTKNLASLDPVTPTIGKSAASAGRRTSAPGSAVRAVKPSSSSDASDHDSFAVVTNPKSVIEATTTSFGLNDPWGPFALARGDLNRDGRPDLVRGSPSGDELRISDGAGWRSVRVGRSDEATLFDFDGVATYPDLTGDGAGELGSDGDFLVTNAFSGPTLPGSIDLSSRRPYDASDLNLGVDPSRYASPSLLDYLSVVGSVADVTGDGLPEIALRGMGMFTLSSNDVGPGRPGRFAVIRPMSGVSSDWEQARFLSTGVSRAFRDDAVRTLGIVTPAGMTVAIPSDSSRHPERARAIELRTTDGLGRTTASRSFVSTGVPRVLDFEPTTGETLVALWELCTTEPSCGTGPTRIARIGAAGENLGEIDMSANYEGLPSAAFIADGPDADAQLEVAAWYREPQDLSLSRPRPTKAGTIAILESGRRGRFVADDLPALGRAGKPLRSSIAPSAVRLANGTRWLSAGFETGTNPKTFRKDDVLVALAP